MTRTTSCRAARNNCSDCSLQLHRPRLLRSPGRCCHPRFSGRPRRDCVVARLLVPTIPFGFATRPGRAIRCFKLDLDTGSRVGDEYELWPGSAGKAPQSPHHCQERVVVVPRDHGGRHGRGPRGDIRPVSCNNRSVRTITARSGADPSRARFAVSGYRPRRDGAEDGRRLERRPEGRAPDRAARTAGCRSAPAPAPAAPARLSTCATTSRLMARSRSVG